MKQPAKNKTKQTKIKKNPGGNLAKHRQTDTDKRIFLLL